MFVPSLQVLLRKRFSLLRDRTRGFQLVRSKYKDSSFLIFCRSLSSSSELKSGDVSTWLVTSLIFFSNISSFDNYLKQHFLPLFSKFNSFSFGFILDFDAIGMPIQQTVQDTAFNLHATPFCNEMVPLTLLLHLCLQPLLQERFRLHLHHTA